MTLIEDKPPISILVTLKNERVGGVFQERVMCRRDSIDAMPFDGRGRTTVHHKPYLIHFFFQSISL